VRIRYTFVSHYFRSSPRISPQEKSLQVADLAAKRCNDLYHGWYDDYPDFCRYCHMHRIEHVEGRCLLATTKMKIRAND
jgi:hypothetical protein